MSAFEAADWIQLRVPFFMRYSTVGKMIMERAFLPLFRFYPAHNNTAKDCSSGSTI